MIQDENLYLNKGMKSTGNSNVCKQKKYFPSIIKKIFKRLLAP